MAFPMGAPGLREGSLHIAADPASYQPHFTHDADRSWPETNCYFDLGIELLHALGLDPVPAFACTLSADHDGVQWSFLKQPPEDLRRLYGLEIAEENVWQPVLETIESGPSRGILHTVEVDSWWLPDTAGTAYRSEHVKTTILPTRVDREARLMWYLHNAGLYELRDEDFDGVFGQIPTSAVVLPPYIEQIRLYPGRVEQGALETIAREHASRLPQGNPIDRLADGVRTATKWLPDAGMEKFHLWAFATLRQCGATAELTGDLVVCVDSELPGAAEAAVHFRTVATGAKSVQFKMARVARGRTTDVEPTLREMASSWQSGRDILVAALS
jgi:hypothetical protein